MSWSDFGAGEKEMESEVAELGGEVSWEMGSVMVMGGFFLFMRGLEGVGTGVGG